MSSLTPGGHVDDAGRFLLESRIATGGMGEVWSARDTVLDRPVAVKVLKAEYADDATFRTRFATEARHAAALHHHGIAAVFDFGQRAPQDGSDTPLPYLVMELVEGQPLSALLRPGAPLDPDVTRDLMAQTAEALGAAHAAGIVHRDVKPANLLLTPDRRVKVTDFGIARAAEGMSLTETGQVLGTPAYISPEQAQGETATAASDVYSLGVVAFECLAGRKPFTAATPVATALAHLREPVPDLPDSVPSDLAGVVRRALAKDPTERWRDGADLARALRDPGAGAAALAGAALGVGAGGAATQVMAAASPDPAPVAAPAPAPTPRQARTRPRGAPPWPLIIGLAAIFLVLLLAVWFATRGDDTDGAGAATDTPSETPSQTPSETASPTPSETPTETPTSTAPEPTTVEVDPADYVGGKAKDAEKALADLGLVPELVEVDNPGDAEKDVVTDVSPSGTLEEGDTVTVTYWGKPPKGNGPDKAQGNGKGTQG